MISNTNDFLGAFTICHLDNATIAIKSESGIALLLQSCTQCLQSVCEMRAAWLWSPLLAGLVALWPGGRGANINQELYGSVLYMYCTVQELYGSDSAVGARRPILGTGALHRDGLEVGAESVAEASQVCAGI